MLIGSIYGWELGRDDIFNPFSARNRDNCLEPMRVLQKIALSKNIEIHTADVTDSLGLKPDFNLYVESVPVDNVSSGINCLLLLETPLTVPLNANYSFLNQFDLIFTWDLELLNLAKSGALWPVMPRPNFVEIRIPNPVPNLFSESAIGFLERPQFCCLIGSNRHANTYDDRELYSERVRAIRWFESNTNGQFYLYGNGWNVPQKRLGSLGKLVYRLEKVVPFLLGKPVFPSYQGPAVSKQEVLGKTRFCICYENARDISGYLTEKIFDCLFAGCIPIYWGEPHIEKWLPPECFIDFRKFASYQDLYQYISSMTEEDFIKMQIAGRKFVSSEAFQIHSSQSFAKIIVETICSKIYK